MRNRRTHHLNTEFVLAECDKLGWDLKDLAKNAGVDPKTISLVVTKGEKASMKTINGICRALDTSPTAVLKSDTPEVPIHAPPKQNVVFTMTVPISALGDLPEWIKGLFELAEASDPIVLKSTNEQDSTITVEMTESDIHSLRQMIPEGGVQAYGWFAYAFKTKRIEFAPDDVLDLEQRLEQYEAWLRERGDL
jgi:DNA-binding Xre family transcriptional regulator